MTNHLQNKEQGYCIFVDFAKIRDIVPKTVLRSLYFSFINPFVEYNLLNWGTAPQTGLNIISNKIKKAIRIISFKKYDHPSIPLFKDLNILPLDKMIKLSQAKFMWKLNHDLIPPSLRLMFRFNERSQLSSIFPRLNAFSEHITFSGTQLWNDIPNSIKNKFSIKSFTRSMQSFLAK